MYLPLCRKRKETVLLKFKSKNEKKETIKRYWEIFRKVFSDKSSSFRKNREFIKIEILSMT